MSRVIPRQLMVAGVLLGVLAAAFWLVRGGPGVDLLVEVARDLWGAAFRAAPRG